MNRKARKLGVVLILIVSPVVILPGQAMDVPIHPMNNRQLMTGVVVEAIGFGLFTAAGPVVSLDLGAGLIMIQVAPLFSIPGAWVTQNFMQKTSDFWLDQGVQFEPAEYLRKSRIHAIITTAGGVGALFVPLLMPNTAGAIVSVVLSAAAVGTDMISLFGVRMRWSNDLSNAILESGVDWRAAGYP